MQSTLSLTTSTTLLVNIAFAGIYISSSPHTAKCFNSDPFTKSPLAILVK